MKEAIRDPALWVAASVVDALVDDLTGTRQPPDNFKPAGACWGSPGGSAEACWTLEELDEQGQDQKRCARCRFILLLIEAGGIYQEATEEGRA